MDVGPLAPIDPYTGRSGFVHIAKIICTYTGETIDAGFEIHTDDLDWAIELWNERAWLDWRLDQAERERTISA